MSDSLKTILAALLTCLRGVQSGGNAAFGLVAEELATAQIPADGYPAAIVMAGPARPNPNITSTIELHVTVNIRILCATNSSDLYDLNDLVTDAICNDPQLGGTCMGALVQGFDPPYVWQGKPLILDRQVEIIYRRDF